MSAGSNLLERVCDALLGPTVAEAAGVDADVWSSADTPRVFRGVGGYLGGRNRGRLPFLEVEVTGQDYRMDSPEGGTLTQAIRVRVHAGGSDLGAVSDLTELICSAALAAVRVETTDNLTALGDDQVGPLQPSPWGHQRDCSCTILQTYDRETYET